VYAIALKPETIPGQYVLPSADNEESDMVRKGTASTIFYAPQGERPKRKVAMSIALYSLPKVTNQTAHSVHFEPP
jgi:hypothetical protein